MVWRIVSEQHACLTTQLVGLYACCLQSKGMGWLCPYAAHCLAAHAGALELLEYVSACASASRQVCEACRVPLYNRMALQLQRLQLSTGGASMSALCRHLDFTWVSPGVVVRVLDFAACTCGIYMVLLSQQSTHCLQKTCVHVQPSTCTASLGFQLGWQTARHLEATCSVCCMPTLPSTSCCLELLLQLLLQA
ncbi:hypothetical protein COO60DRAFT_262601 [Scenedesmus sp. NREL 46B-D3]|nr:hypothetical protein COO60DRAFT_262601 [Scenedesmus sp. NREL 46B-D3]